MTGLGFILELITSVLEIRDILNALWGEASWTPVAWKLRGLHAILRARYGVAMESKGLSLLDLDTADKEGDISWCQEKWSGEGGRREETRKKEAKTGSRFSCFGQVEETCSQF